MVVVRLGVGWGDGVGLGGAGRGCVRANEEEGGVGGLKKMKNL